eukprot:scaffold295575_cov19-Tisochrysis_lutea.AAC.1
MAKSPDLRNISNPTLPSSALPLLDSLLLRFAAHAGKGLGGMEHPTLEDLGPTEQGGGALQPSANSSNSSSSSCGGSSSCSGSSSNNGGGDGGGGGNSTRSNDASDSGVQG